MVLSFSPISDCAHHAIFIPKIFYPKLTLPKFKRIKPLETCRIRITSRNWRSTFVPAFNHKKPTSRLGHSWKMVGPVKTSMPVKRNHIGF